MTAICVALAGVMAMQGCASSGTVAVGPATPTVTAPSSPAGSTTATAPATSGSATDSATPTASGSDTSSPAAPSTPAAPSSSAASSPAVAGHWQPGGELAKAEPVDQSVGPDQKVTVTWPKGAPAAHALTIKLLAKRNGGMIDVTMFAANESGQKVSLLTGMFGGAGAVDETGASMGFEEFDKDWTLTNPSNDGYLVSGQPMNGVMAIDAPKTGNTFNMYWTQAVNLGGIILIRDIPIVG